MDDRLSAQRIAALAGVVLLIGAGLSFTPAILAQEGGDAPTPGADGDINCDEFDNREQIGEVFDPNNDEFGLDRDDDNIACEGVGDNPTPEEPGAAATDEPTATATATETETATETVTATETATETTTEEATETERETETTTETETEQPTASVTFNNQTSDGTTVVVESVTMSEGGFIAIHNASLLEGNVQGSVVGVSEPLSAGTHENVEVTLFDVPGQNFAEGMTLEESQTLIAMPHFDTNDNGVYDFITSNATEDGAYTENGSAVVDPASVTVEDEEAVQDDEQPAEADDKEAQAETAYYQVDFVVGEPIENFDTEGTYANDRLLRFAHGSTDDPVVRRAPGVLAYADAPELNERIESQEITIENGTATITFTIDEGESLQLSLVSYEKVGPGWSPATEDKQEFIDAETQTFEAGTHTLTVDLPDEDSSDD